MLSYCWKCRKNTKNKIPRVAETKSGRIMILSNCHACGIKKDGFIKQHQASEILITLAEFFKKNSFNRFCFILGILAR